jgi:cell division septation protein DedD
LADYEHPSREGREASYYELALSNRQVFLAVFVLLLGIAGAFLAGVWFARGSAPATRVSQSAAPVEAAAKERVGEYKFFSEKDKPRPAAGTQLPAPTPVKPAPATESAAATPVASSDASPETSPTPAGEGGAAAAPALPPAMAQAPAATTAAKAAAAAPAATPAAVAGDLFVQVFSSADIAQAKRVVGQLQRAGYKGFIAPLANVNGQTLHRVRVGPYRERDLAQKAADAIRQRLKFSTWITNTQ